MNNEKLNVKLVVKKKIESLENKIDRLQIENKRLVEESTNCMKIIKLLSVKL